MGDLREGMVVHKSSRSCRVREGPREWVCVYRGRLKGMKEHPVAVGDRVLFRPTAEGEGVMEARLDRRSKISRSAGAGREQVFAANIDQVLIVSSLREPPLRPPLIDRLLVACEREGVDAVVCVNKIDLGDPSEAEEAMAPYVRIGYRVLYASAVKGTGLGDLRDALRDRVTVLAGHSGVGKSSLLNALIPGAKLRTGDVSRTARGRHVTSAVWLLELPGGGFVADTPGFREFDVFGLKPEEIGRYYRDFMPHIAGCQFSDCLHLSEPNCAVRDAVAAGNIPDARYKSYRSIVEARLGCRPGR